MAGERGGYLVSVEVPQPDGPVVARGRQDAPLWGEGHVPYSIALRSGAVSFEHGFGLPPRSAPDPDGAVGAGGGEGPAVGTEGHRVDRAVVSLQNGDGTACGGLPQPYAAVGTGGGEHCAVR
ncbi:hypothetical protein GCM10010145_58470 [Streptomyces ruber]|uniref:Uncharacterized protein n=2 Tax=Streptomyces TaxID=1883 RepID=A0A918BP61_9ACTN|nr:hypothetical protein GCM10010145_58470 [Streptomyces ruber]